MVKQDKLEIDGKIVEVLPAGKFKVELKDMDTVILCYKSGKMKMSHISVIVDDWVKVEVSPYDMGQGRIVYRYNQSYGRTPDGNPILKMHNKSNPNQPTKWWYKWGFKKWRK